MEVDGRGQTIWDTFAHTFGTHALSSCSNTCCCCFFFFVPIGSGSIHGRRVRYRSKKKNSTHASGPRPTGHGCRNFRVSETCKAQTANQYACAPFQVQSFSPQSLNPCFHSEISHAQEKFLCFGRMFSCIHHGYTPWQQRQLH